MKDDCAAIEFKDDYLLLTTDMISGQAHLPENATPWQIGWHVIAVNLSDIAAMGGEPFGLVMALGLPQDYEVESLKKIVEGMNSCALKFNSSILGGDTKEAEAITISGCALGRVKKSDIMLRKGCKPKDIVAVSGELGRAAAGYYSAKNIFNEEKGLKNLLEVQPRVNEGMALAKTGLVTACMDISDGLASSIYQLSQINGLGFKLVFDQIPVSIDANIVSEKLQIPIEELALYFGGDYELLVTIDGSGIDEAQKALSKYGTKLTPIGEVVKEKKNILIKDGVSTFLENRGYEHFRRKP